ncbi:hypothetical protein B0T22DRAFT_465234 [Podospora appendiculata]|uniref:Glucan 1, 4-alpha-glucosidase n=1 Tax=Podospora appendiculata TaxID=314037 RepID=A0AAE0X4X8_9PEZI|nr:hypothetical protein B0T22DRAFT_465234 [Podospora appendiculata]
MDDPWGSPWTTDHDKHHKPSSPAKSTKSARSTRSELEPPPRAFFSNCSSSSPRIPAITAESPWADVDDHGLGDWAAPELLGSTPTGWGGAWGGTASPSLVTSPPRHDAFGKTSDTFGKAGPIAWPGSIAIPQASSGSALRHPSPDPWATDFSARTPSRDDFSTPRLVIDSPRPLEVLGDMKRKLDEEPEPMWDAHGDTSSGHGTAPHQEVVAVEIRAEPSVPSSAREQQEQDTVDRSDHVRPSVESVSASHNSRPSSPSGDDTDDEDDRQDSPITSIDEESRVRQQVVRQTSGKVQQLVTKFDGLARSLSQEPRPISSRGRSESQSAVDVDDGSDEAGDFGDFEDADEVVELPDISTPERTVTPRAVSGSPGAWNSPEASSPQSARDTSLKSEQPISKFGLVKFEVDLGNVDALFGKESLDSAPSVAIVDPDISDHIVTDSFTEISERKTWYRISRLGSSMKHNAGDDDNYRRVAWPTSAVRLDTIKTVRRWMEEDSITGRVTLGGGVSKTQKNMFGWDSSLEPVALDTVFGKRKTHSRASSLQPLPAMGLPTQGPKPTTRKPSGSLQGLAQRPSSMGMPPGAAFGWSTSSPTSHTQTPLAMMIQPPAVPEVAPDLLPVSTPKPQTSRKPSPPPATTQSGPVALTPPVPKLPKFEIPATLSLGTKPPLAQGSSPLPHDEDADDDWGEMVSSPTEAKPGVNGFHIIDDAFPTPPSSSGLRGSTISIVPGTSETKLRTLVTAHSPTTALVIDPWKAVDLSVFEPPASKTPVLSTKPPIAGATFFSSTATPRSISPISPPLLIPAGTLDMPACKVGMSNAKQQLQVGNEDHFTPTTPLEIASPICLPTPTHFDDDKALEIGHTPDYEAVQRIIANLPDLSYMLR